MSAAIADVMPFEVFNSRSFESQEVKVDAPNFNHNPDSSIKELEIEQKDSTGTPREENIEEIDFKNVNPII